MITALDDAATQEADSDTPVVGWRRRGHARAAGLAAIARNHLSTRTTGNRVGGNHADGGSRNGNGTGSGRDRGGADTEDGRSAATGGAAPVAAVDVTVALERLENPADGRTRPHRGFLDGRVPAQLAGLLCTTHHRAVHEGHWTPVLHADGTVEISRGRQTLRSTPRTTTGLDLHRLPERRPRRPARPDFTRPPTPARARPDPQTRGRPPDTPPDAPF